MIKKKKFKKGYLKTLEAIIAMIITFGFILYFLPGQENTLNEDTNNVLISLINSESFRVAAVNLSNCTSKGENSSINTIIDEKLREYVFYSICPKGILPTLPRKKVNVESIYLTGNITHKTDKIIKLYYWE